VALSTSSPSTFGLDTRLIQDQKGRYMFVGDSANLSFLQVIRRSARQCVGPCAFVDDPLRCLMVEACPEGEPNWLKVTIQGHPPRVSLEDAQQLVKNFIIATNCVLDMFDEADLLKDLPSFCNDTCQDSPLPMPIYYLVLAIGAQTAHKPMDELAEKLFTHGRYITAQTLMEDPSTLTVQSYALITMYLLGSCRRNAAFMHLGIAVRAAYAIGLHSRQVAMSFSADEFRTRERLWKVIRVLDLFMSASLGRPPSISETRDTEANENYSASNDLCSIFEKILTNVYLRKMVTNDTLHDIVGHQRRWASRFSHGLENDKIEASEILDDGAVPNIGLLHIKEAYYWTIILVTRPFLTQSVLFHMRKVSSYGTGLSGSCTDSGINKTLVNACVDSAIRTIDLLKVFLGCQQMPKRLPFIVNSLFIAALVLGFSFFGDLYQNFPLERYLQKAHQLLAQFPRDAIAQRNASIISYLIGACDTYLEKRTAQNMDQQSIAVGSMFGQIHELTNRTLTQAPQVTTDRISEPSGPSLDANAQLTRMPQITASTMEFEQDQSEPILEDVLNTFDVNIDLATMPCSNPTPQAWWFESWDENLPLFSTINVNEFHHSPLGTA